jgi:hypothetical protein
MMFSVSVFENAFSNVSSDASPSLFPAPALLVRIFSSESEVRCKNNLPSEDSK